MNINKVLEHYGVLGMKWGKYKDRRYVSRTSTPSAFVKVYNKAADVMNNGEIARINNSPKYKGKDFSKKENQKLYEEYLKDHNTALNKAMRDASVSILGQNPSKTKQAVWSWNTETGKVVFDLEDVEHASEGEKPIRYIAKLDSLGHIVSIYIEEKEVLAHYGVLGMKWGKRKARTPSQEHVRSRKLQKKRIFEMTNEELQAVAGRLELESRYKSVSNKKFDKVSKKVQKAVDSYGNQVVAGLAGAAAVKTVEIILKKIKQ